MVFVSGLVIIMRDVSELYFVATGKEIVHVLIQLLLIFFDRD